MNIQEFSDQFDTLLNSYNIQAGFGEGSSKQGGITLDEYEKSVLLTQAQDNIVKAYFDRSMNGQGQGIDDSTRRQVDFSSLIKVAYFKNYNDDSILVHDTEKCYDDRGLIVNLDEDKKILFIMNERLEVGMGPDKMVYVIVPINYREYDREMSKSYGQPLKKQAWRLFSNASTGYDIDSEIIPIYGTVNTKEVTQYFQAALVDSSASNSEYEWEDVTEATEKLVESVDDMSKLNIKGPVYSKSDLPAPSSTTTGVYKVITSKVDDYLNYVIRYVKRPTPIILRKLPNNLKIDGYDGSETFSSDSGKKIYTGNGFNCSLNPILHMDILSEAYRLAIATRGGGTAVQPRQDNDRQNR